MPPPAFVFAPGAGAPSSSAWMQRYADYLSKLGPVDTFDYPYQLAGRKYPDRLPVLVAAHKEAIARTRRHLGPIVLVGKSMGSRVGCHASLDETVAGLVCLGYPLLGAGDPAKRRDEVLLELTTPVLFVQGTRDPLCPLPELEALLPRLRTRAELHVVDEGDHSLQVTRSYLKRNATSQEAIDQQVVAAIEGFVAALSSAVP